MCTWGEQCDTLVCGWTASCQPLQTGFYAAVYEFGKGGSLHLPQCYHSVWGRSQKKSPWNVDFSFLGKPSNAPPAPHGNTVSIPTEGRSLLLAPLPHGSCHCPFGGSFVHTGIYVPTPLFCSKSPTKIMSLFCCCCCFDSLETQSQLILNSLRAQATFKVEAIPTSASQDPGFQACTTTPTHFSLDHTCQPNCATTKATSGPHHLTSLVPADMVGLIGDISCSLHPLEKEKNEKRILIPTSPLKCQHLFLVNMQSVFCVVEK